MNRTDVRKENTRNPNIDFWSFFNKSYKDWIAFALVIITILILLINDGNLSERLSTLLITIASGATGYIIGRKV
jgi:TctA family transporter